MPALKLTRTKAEPRKPIASAPRLRLEVDERRAQLVAFGLTYFSDRPYEDVSIDELAKAAGISKGLLYHYFPTKRAFYAATVEAAAAQLLDAILLQEGGASRDRVERGLRAYFDFVETHKSAFTSLFRAGTLVPEVNERVEATREAFVDRILEQIPLTRTPMLRAALRGWIGSVEAMSLEFAKHGDFDREAATELLVEQLFSTLSHVLQLPVEALKALATQVSPQP